MTESLVLDRPVSGTEQDTTPQVQQTLPLEPKQQRIIAVKGDLTAQFLLEQAMKVVSESEADVEIVDADLSFKTRQRDGEAVDKVAQKLQETGYGIRASTLGADYNADLGNANLQLRRAIGANVIERTARQIEGLEPIGGRRGAITVVRLGVNDMTDKIEANEDQEFALRTESISGNVSKLVAKHTFAIADRLSNPVNPNLKEDVLVVNALKVNTHPAFYGIFNNDIVSAYKEYKDKGISYKRISSEELPFLMVKTVTPHIIIPAIGEIGDDWSNFAFALMGHQLSTAPSMTLALDPDRPSVVLTETIHGVGRKMHEEDRWRFANPTASILAAGQLLENMPDPKIQFEGYRIRQAVFDTIRSGTKTYDLKGSATTEIFTREVINRIK